MKAVENRDCDLKYLNAFEPKLTLHLVSKYTRLLKNFVNNIFVVTMQLQNYEIVYYKNLEPYSNISTEPYTIRAAQP